LLVKDDFGCYEKYRNNLYAAFCWMERTRNSTKNSHYDGKGIFPPMRGCDWDAVEQAWSLTDVPNLDAYKALRDAFCKYGDEALPEIEAAIEDYTACIRKVWEKEIEEQKDNNELILYGSIGAKKCDPLLTQPNVGLVPRLVLSGVFPIDSEYTQKYRNYYKNRNLIKNGLHDILNASSWYNMNWIGHVWYTNCGDYIWFKYYMKTNQRDLAEETLKGQLKFSMTEEYYMLERYAANDKYYVPWSPNASANGRTIMMLCDFYNAD